MAKPYQGDDTDYFSAVRDEEGNIKRDTPKKMTFGQAFASARKAGDKEFTFGGKKYNTRTKEDSPKVGEGKTASGMAREARGVKDTPKAAAPKAEAPKAEAPKAETSVKRGAPRMGERKVEPKKEITPRGRMKAGNRARTTEEPTATASSGSTAVERMRNKMKEKYGSKSGGTVKMRAGGSVSSRADGIAKRGKTKCKIV